MKQKISPQLIRWRDLKLEMARCETKFVRDGLPDSKMSVDQVYGEFLEVSAAETVKAALCQFADEHELKAYLDQRLGLHPCHKSTDPWRQNDLES